MQIAKLRSVLREYCPTFLAAFAELASREARAVLHLAPAPAQGQSVRRASLTAALRRAGRTRGIPDTVERIHTALHQDQLRQLSQVEAAMAHHATALLHALDTAVGNVADLEAALAAAFEQRPDAEIITSFPGLGTVLGARILVEIGDDRTRFSDARGLKAFAGTAPITRVSGMKTLVARRVVRNKRLGQAAYLWALPMIAHSPGAHARFVARRERGDSAITMKDALAATITTLPEQLRRSLTWDRGKRCLRTPSSRSRPACRSTSPIRKARGSVARTRT
jgi:hypothetical protein